MTTTIETVTKAQVRRLRTEAAEAGDSAMVEICDLAFGAWSDQPPVGGDIGIYRRALTECVRVICAAEAAE